MIKGLGRRGGRMLLIATAMLAGAAGIALATIPGTNAVINGCFEKRTGLLRVIDTEAGKKCLSFETEISWSQQGPKGDQGIQGAKGDQGQPGIQGDQGIQGIQGDQGIQGEKGDQGIQGIQGEPGIQGERGPEGRSGTSAVYHFRAVEGLLQPPFGVREAIAGTLPPGRYFLLAKISMNSLAVAEPAYVSSTNTCELKGDTEKLDDVVLDADTNTHAPLSGWASSVLFAIHEVTSPSTGEVKVDCFNLTGGGIRIRSLTAIKVDAFAG